MRRRIPGKSFFARKAHALKGGPREPDKRAQRRRKRKADRSEERDADRGESG